MQTIILPTETHRFYDGHIPETVHAVWVGNTPGEEKISMDHITAHLDGIAFDILDDGRRLHVDLPLLGMHNAGNLTRAYAAATVYGDLSEDEIQNAVRKVHLPSGRLERWTGPEGTSFLHDAYNANPSSMAEAMRLMQQYDVPKCLILGDMRELGPQSPDLHRALGKSAAAVHPVRLLCVGDSADFIRNGAIGAGLSPDSIRCVVSDELDIGLKWLEPALTPQTLCLIKGSRGVRLERVLDYFHAERRSSHTQEPSC